MKMSATGLAWIDSVTRPPSVAGKAKLGAPSPTSGCRKLGIVISLPSEGMRGWEGEGVRG